MKLRLHAVDCDSRAFYYSGTCKRCGHMFVFCSRNGLLRQLWDRARFELAAAEHVAGCVNNRVEQILKGGAK